MGYALVILEPPGQRQARTEEQGRAVYERMVRFSEELRGRGLLTLAQSLASDRGAARVRVQDRQASIVDGPFVEAREMVGGFLLLTCATRAEAVAIARQCPAAEWATVEVRELGPCFT
ncbi:MAG TPA: YciI family protein [Steroidobacteraceae bacterium]|jgi:hypothetical protein|nr:YciI family protein [Steroidobacteraceae bacterium]